MQQLVAKAGWNGDIEMAGLLLVAASLSADLWLESARLPTPSYLVIGSEDRMYDPVLLDKMSKEEIPVEVDVREGLGHEAPPDIARTVATGLD